MDTVVVPAELAGELPPVGWCARGDSLRRKVSGGDPAAAVGAEPAAQAADGSLGKLENLGKGGDGLALLEPIEELLTDGERDRAWHGGSSRCQRTRWWRAGY